MVSFLAGTTRPPRHRLHRHHLHHGSWSTGNLSSMVTQKSLKRCRLSLSNLNLNLNLTTLTLQLFPPHSQ